MVYKVIKTEAQYSEALARLSSIFAAKPNTAEGDELELLSKLIEFYEQEHFPIDLPDPVGAIKFRMEQRHLSQKDLVPLLGSKSKVSEVLSKKRPLSLKMIRRLHEELGIPAQVLLGSSTRKLSDSESNFKWSEFPIVDMARRGWFPSFQDKPNNSKDFAEELLGEFFSSVDEKNLKAILLRQHIRAGANLNQYSLLAWQVRVLQIAQEMSLPSYEPGSMDAEFLNQLARLSYLDPGPALAREFLSKNGIALVVLSHLPKTYLDGAATIGKSGNPVVGLTLRHDRLDNFWFTLFHELGHVALHLESGEAGKSFIDNLDVAGDEIEREADLFAESALIGNDSWKRFKSQGRYAASQVRLYANQQKISPAIVAGRVRRELNSYGVLGSLLGQGDVRQHFRNLEGSAQSRGSQNAK